MESNNYILYIAQNCNASHRLVNMLEQSQHSALKKFYLQDVAALHRWPLWLVGTPILADQTGGIIYKGTEVFVFFENFLKKIPTRPVTHTMALPSATAMETDDDIIYKTPTRDVDTSKKLTADCVEALMAQRAQQVPQQQPIA